MVDILTGRYKVGFLQAKPFSLPASSSLQIPGRQSPRISGTLAGLTGNRKPPGTLVPFYSSVA
jgi:hypothetical protein